MIAASPSAKPQALLLRLFLSGLGMSALLHLSYGGTWSALWKMWLFLPPSPQPTEAVSSMDLPTLGSSFAIALLAWMMAITASLTLISILVRLGAFALHLTAIAARLLLAIPLGAAVWIWIGCWSGQQGRPIETWLPAHPSLYLADGTTPLAIKIWTSAPLIFFLSLPLMGIILPPWIRQLILLIRTAPHETVSGSFFTRLRSRGLSRSQIRLRHLLPILIPIWRQRLQGSLLITPIFLIIVEATLHFKGWGFGMAESLQRQSPDGIATGIYTGTLLLLALTWIAHLPRSVTTKKRSREAIHYAPPNAPSTPPKKERLAHGLLFFILLTIGLTVTFIPHPGWVADHLPPIQIRREIWTAWTQDLIGTMKSLLIAICLGPALALLRYTSLAERLRRFGILETLSWCPLALWALAWSYCPGQVLSMDITLGMAAAIFLSVELYAVNKRSTMQPCLEAAKVLGATSGQAWIRHALRPWSLDLASSIAWLAAAIWILRILFFSLLDPGKTIELHSIGSLIARDAALALHSTDSLLLASLIAGVSILFFFSLSRIILPNDDL